MYFSFLFSGLVLRDSVFTKFYRSYMRGVPFVNYKVYERGTFSVKIVTKTRVRGWTLRAEPREPREYLEYVQYIPLPRRIYTSHSRLTHFG